MKEVLKSFVVIIFYLASFLDYGVGLIHSFKKHGIADGLIGAIAFPWAMYRGVEFWFHNDFSDVNWDKRLESDMKTCVYLFSQAQMGNKIELNESIEKFSNKINEYPAEKKRFLVDGARLYLTYFDKISINIIASLDTYIKEGRFEIIQNSSVEKLENELTKYYLKEEVSSVKIGMEDLKKKIQLDFPLDSNISDRKNIINLKNSIEFQLRNQKTDFRRVYKQIFNINFQ
jgi:hypothetical protein